VADVHDLGVAADPEHHATADRGRGIGTEIREEGDDWPEHGVRMLPDREIRSGAGRRLGAASVVCDGSGRRRE
jgi:hypothetical protein